MATFKERVVGLTGLTINASSDPTLDQLSQFLRDGVLDVTNRWLAVKPQEREDFIAVTAEQTSNGANLNGADIISVVRESGSNDDWRNCRRILAGMQGRVVDQDSLYFASEFNPAYTKDEDGKINVFPVPGADPNAYKIYYVNNSPVNDSGVALAHGDSDLKYFPNDKFYLVVLFAGMRCFQAVMGGLHSSSDIDTAFTNFRSALLNATAKFDLGKTATDRIDDNLYNGLNFNVALGRFKKVKDALDNAEELLDGAVPAAGYNAFSYFLREDPEMVQSSLQMAAQEINRANSSLSELGGIADLASKEAQTYMAVGGGFITTAQQYLTEVQAQSAETNKEYTWYSGRYRALKTEYDQAFGIATPQPAQQQPQQRRRAR